MNLLINDESDLRKLILDTEYLVERRSPKALPLAKKAMQLAIRSTNPSYFVYAKYLLAFYYSLVKNDYDKAIEMCNEVLEELNGEESEISYKLYMTLGNSYQLKGDVFAAQECYLKGLKQLEAKKHVNSRETGFLASLYYNLSLLMSSSDMNNTSEEYLQKAIKIYEEIENGFKLSKCYVAYAGILEHRKQYGQAIEVIRKAMLYEKAMVKVSLGETLFATGKKQEGIVELQEAEALFNRLENRRELSNVCRHLSEFFESTGDYKSALDYQRRHTESLKYFFDIDKTNAITRAQKEFETEQREKETTLLREKNEEVRNYVHKLEISNNELKQFANVASHDMREPLRMIASYMSLLKKSLNGKLSGQQEEFIGFAIDGCKRLEQLIVDLLRLAKVDANPRVESVRLHNVVDEVNLNLDRLIKEKGAKILAGDLPEILADRTQMLQLFQNIIGNGIKYNENCRPVIRVKFTKRREEVEVSIGDNGIGIPEHQREKAFQIFQRLHTERQYTGSGIGLSICKKIVEGMGGKIRIDDNPTGGTIFRMTFPANLCVSGH
jgi:signal transduction histidine kinase